MIDRPNKTRPIKSHLLNDTISPKQMELAMTPNGIENCITKIIEEVEVVCAKERYIKGYRPRPIKKP